MSELVSGQLNSIADVKGVTVGHITLDDGSIQTGVTAILPHQGNLFQNKCVAAVEIINGFGKSVGLMQIQELGQLETPIVLTNTLSVGVASDALIKYMLKDNADIGTDTGTVNPLVMECNDGYLNDIRGQHIKTHHILAALKNTNIEFKQGAVGAGRGMSAYKLKGGIGSSSRLVPLNSDIFTIGALVMTNMGRLRDFIMYGNKLGGKLKQQIYNNVSIDAEADKGSIIMILATDLPMDARQLKRLAKRATIGLAKTGSQLGNGSGDICLAFSTANQMAHYQDKIETVKRFPEDKIDNAFDAAIGAIEEAIINSMLNAKTLSGRQGNKRLGLKSLL
ncbi:MAG: P1 family peptidase [Rhizobiales bacterium]|nr:P1 family peptidase [Hyphomicrobiales bacterium]